MPDAHPCPRVPSLRLMENYQRCLRQRLELWFGDSAELLWSTGETGFEVRLGERRAVMKFQSEVCQWRLESADSHAWGSFDRVSKRLRQIFSGLA